MNASGILIFATFLFFTACAQGEPDSAARVPRNSAPRGFIPLKVGVSEAGAVHLSDQSRILGGTRAAFGDAAHQVALLIAVDGQTYLCGGAAISKEWVLTAAHCMSGVGVGGGAAKHITVISGTNLLDGKSGTTSVAVSVAVHPRYDVDAPNDFDFALVRAPLDAKTVPIKLADGAATGNLKEGQTLTVTGYGATKEGGSSSVELRKVDVPFVSHSDCTRDPDSNYPEAAITAQMLCAGAEGKDSCQGDSGSSLFRDGVEFGVVSWGEGCGEAGKFGVYARAASALEWIEATRNSP